MPQRTKGFSQSFAGRSAAAGFPMRMKTNDWENPLVRCGIAWPEQTTARPITKRPWRRRIADWPGGVRLSELARNGNLVILSRLPTSGVCEIKLEKV